MNSRLWGIGCFGSGRVGLALLRNMTCDFHRQWSTKEEVASISDTCLLYCEGIAHNSDSEQEMTKIMILLFSSTNDYL